MPKDEIQSEKKKSRKLSGNSKIPGILSGYEQGWAGSHEQYLCFCHVYTMSCFIKLSQSSTLKLFFL